MKKVLISMGFAALALGATAQVKIKDGTVTGSSTTPNSNAILELESNNKGLLYPSVSLTATNAVLPGRTMVAGMVVYNTATAGSGATAVAPGFYYSNGTVWVRLIDAPATSTAWSLTGNAGTTAGTNFIGTTDNQGVVFKQNNTQAGWLSSNSLLNTAFGLNTLPTTATGVNNTAVGVSALASNSTGYRNTALGAGSLGNNTTGNNNTAIGLSTLQHIVANDSNNTALGNTAGNTLTAGSYNTAIGANAQLPNTTGNYQLNIVNTIFGTGVDSISGLGNIGIGNTAPAARLTINSAGTTPALQLKAPFSGAATDSLLTWNPADSTVRKIPSSAAITSTAWALTGNAGTTGNAQTSFIGTTDNQDVVFKRNGVQAGLLDVGINNNTSFGVNALAAPSIVNTNNVGNSTALGFNALNVITSGGYNTAVGTRTLQAAQTGGGNVAVGSWAASSLTSGDTSTFVGFAAGSNQTSGKFNIVIGANTALPNTTGNYQLNIGNAIWGTGVDSSVTNAANIMINTRTPGVVATTASGSTAAQQLATLTVNGGDALINNITVGLGGGQQGGSLAVGNANLWNNTTGQQNTAIGQHVLQNNTTGGANTGVGENVLQNNLSGSFNTAIGINSLQGSTGSNNVALGTNAGMNQTAGNTNTLIGYSVSAPNLTGNYQLNIANNIFGTGTDSVYGAGNIGINTNAPNSTFQVAGSVSTPINLQTASYTLTATDYTVIFRTGTALTATLPLAAGVGGRIYRIINQSGGPLTISASAGNSILFLSSTTAIGSASFSVGTTATFQSANGTTWYQIQ